MKRQGQKAEAFCQAPDPASAAVLMFGKPGAPLDEFIELLIANWLKSATEPLDRKRISPEDAKQDPGAIADELFSASLFGGASLIQTHIQRESEAAPFLNALEIIESRGQMPPGRLLVIAGDLGTKSKLRKAFEGAKAATALQFYERTARDFENWLRAQLREENIRLTPDAEAALTGLLLEDQSLARSELQKLSLFASGQETPLSVANVRDLIVPGEQHSHFELIDLALDGKAKELAALLPQIAQDGAAIPLLIGLTNQLKRLVQAHDIAASGVTGPQIGGQLFPRIFDRQWPAFESRMRAWSPPLILALLNRVSEVDAACRRAGSPQEALVARLLMDVAQAASTRHR